MADFDKIHKAKLQFIAKSEAALNARIGGAEKKLLSAIVSKFMDKLDLSNGEIISNSQNIKLTQALDQIFKEFNFSVNNGLISGYISDIEKIKEMSFEYFAAAEPNASNLKGIKKEINTIINSRLGINNKGNIIKGGFLDSFRSDSRFKNEFKELVTKGITSGVTRAEMMQDVRAFIIGNEGAGGKLQRQYATFINDTYQQIDNLTSATYAKALGMESFIYSGTKIKTTRLFCCQRLGKIWTVKEAKKWKTLSFTGKTTPYNPIINLGGYNCRHSTQYISNVVAARRRNDLKLNKNGNLIPDTKGTKQQLTVCR